MSNKRTAISRKSPSLPMKYLKAEHLLDGRMLDYGCGRGFDAKYFGMVKYDPNFAPGRPSGKFNTITCNYVLNVVDIVTQIAILDEIKSLLVEGGTAYVSVRRDLKKMITTHSGYSQRLVRLNGEWELIKENGAFAMYRYIKSELRDLMRSHTWDYEFTCEQHQFRAEAKKRARINELTKDMTEAEVKQIKREVTK